MRILLQWRVSGCKGSTCRRLSPGTTPVSRAAGAQGVRILPAVWFLVSFIVRGRRKAHELQSKLLEGGYLGDRQGSVTGLYRGILGV